MKVLKVNAISEVNLSDGVKADSCTVVVLSSSYDKAVAPEGIRHTLQVDVLHGVVPHPVTIDYVTQRLERLDIPDEDLFGGSIAGLGTTIWSSKLYFNHGGKLRKIVNGEQLYACYPRIIFLEP